MPSNRTACAFTDGHRPRYRALRHVEAGKYAEHTVEDAVSVCAQLVPLFEAAGIPIIRLGLNPTDDLSGGDAAGGAYHPALGELVRSRIMLQKARELLDGITPGSTVTLAVGRGKASQMAGSTAAAPKR